MESLGQVQWTSSNPKIYLTSYYEYNRNGSDMQYRIKLSISKVSGSSSFGYPIYARVSLDGSEKFNITLKNASPSQWSSAIEYTSPWYTISNKTSGTTALSINLYSGSGSSRNATYNYSLYVAPAYANITSFSVAKRDETSVIFNWSADSNCDWAWYSTNNGSSWSDLPNSNIVSGLSAGTGYNFKLKIRRTDSQLTTESSAYYQETYDYPKPTSINNFTIGEGATVYLNNPLGRNVTLELISNNNGGVIGTYTGTYSGTVNAEFKTASAIASQYASIPNSKYGTYYARVTYGSVVKTSGNGTYYCNDNECKPTYTSANITYYDSNTTVAAITQNNQHIVQNKSNLKVNCSGATAKNGASISSYRAVFNGVTLTGTGDLNFGTINLSSNASVTVTAIDSRGYQTSATKQITILAYSSPTAILTAYRQNNYENTSFFKCDATISSVNNKNSMTILYGYAQGSSSTPTASTSINDNQEVTLTLNNQYEYRFIARVQDRFETKDFYIVMPKGTFIEFWDTEMLSVGINGFPTHNEAFEVFGDIYINGVKLDDYIRSIIG